MITEALTPFDLLQAIQTPRLTIRRLRYDDAADIFAYSQDPEVARYVLWEPQRHIGEARRFIRYCRRNYRRGHPASLGIVLKETGRVVGTIGFMWYQEENNAAEVGYSLSRDCWNQGIMTEALQALIAFGFDTMRLNRIEAQHETENPASGRVMEKCGMRYEGTLRSRLMNKGRYVDVRLYAILRTDFTR